MQLRELLPPEHIFAPLGVETLPDAIATMATALLREGALQDPDLGGRILADEARARVVVPVGERAVLPHLRTEGVEKLILALGVSAKPLDARAAGLSIRPQIVALVLAPPETASLYLQTISTIARLVRRDDLVDALAAARSPEDVLRIADLADARVQASLTVRDLMVQRPPVPPDAPVRDVVGIMIDQRVKALPVVGEKGEVLGIITERDVMGALLPQIPRGGEEADVPTRIPLDLTARDIMTRSVLCIAQDMALDEAANLMFNKEVDQFPVVGEGKLVGFLSRGEIIRRLFGR